MGADRAKIGLLWPADGLNDREFWQWIPEDVSLLIARYDVGGTLDLEQLARDGDIEAITGAARLLRHAAPDVITMGDCAGSFIGGSKVNLEQSQAVESVSGSVTITMSTALVEALSRLGANRISVLSPYAHDVTERLHAFFAEHDISVESSRSMGRDNERDIAAMAPEEWMEEVHLANSDAAQALVVAGGGVSLSGIITDLEGSIGKPVIAGPGALMWAALDHLKIAHLSDDCGTLFQARN